MYFSWLISSMVSGVFDFLNTGLGGVCNSTLHDVVLKTIFAIGGVVVF